MVVSFFYVKSPTIEIYILLVFLVALSDIREKYRKFYQCQMFQDMESCYCKGDSAGSADDAKDYCKSIGMHLSIIENWEEFQFVTSNITDSKYKKILQLLTALFCNFTFFHLFGILSVLL